MPSWCMVPGSVSTSRGYLYQVREPVLVPVSPIKSKKHHCTFLTRTNPVFVGHDPRQTKSSTSYSKITNFNMLSLKNIPQIIHPRPQSSEYIIMTISASLFLFAFAKCLAPLAYHHFPQEHYRDYAPL